MTWYYSILCLIIDYFLGTGYETKKVGFWGIRGVLILNHWISHLIDYFFKKNNKVEKIGEKRSDTFFSSQLYLFLQMVSMNHFKTEQETDVC